MVPQLLQLADLCSSVSFNLELKLCVRASQRNRGLQCEKQRHRNATDMSLPLSGVDPTVNRRQPRHESDKKNTA